MPRRCSISGTAESNPAVFAYQNQSVEMLIRLHGAFQGQPGRFPGGPLLHAAKGVDDARSLIQESFDDLCLGVDQFVLLVADGPEADQGQESQKNCHEDDKRQVEPQQQVPHEEPLEAVSGRNCLHDRYKMLCWRVEMEGGEPFRFLESICNFL